MSKIEEAREILKELQVPAKQQADLCCYVLLAMADIKEDDECESNHLRNPSIHHLLLCLP